MPLDNSSKAVYSIYTINTKRGCLCIRESQAVLHIKFKKDRGMEQNRYSYIKKIGRNTYSVVVRQAESATEKVENKIRRLLVNDLSKEL